MDWEVKELSGGHGISFGQILVIKRQGIFLFCFERLQLRSMVMVVYQHRKIRKRKKEKERKKEEKVVLESFFVV